MDKAPSKAVGAFLIALLFALPVGAQDGSVKLDPLAPVVWQSPIPSPRGMPPELERPRDLTPAPDPETVVEPLVPGVTVLRPDGQDSGRVVVRENPEREVVDDAEDAEARNARWREERSDRFKRAPRSPESPNTGIAVRPVAPITPPDTELLQGAVVRELDKMTGQINTLSVTAGETIRVSRLRVRLEACRAPGDGSSHGTMAFLKVWDMKNPDEEIFSGWMFAESPALSAMDHPRYDLWLISCTTSDGGTSAAKE